MIKPTLSHERPAKIQAAAWVGAGMITLMLLLQLIKFEDFSSVLAAVLSYNDQALVTLSAAGIVIAELFALPYLLGMTLSPLMRQASAVMAAAVALFWLFLTLTSAHSANSGLFGAAIELPGGIIAVLWSLILVICVAIDLVYMKQAPAPPTS